MRPVTSKQIISQDYHRFHSFPPNINGLNGIGVEIEDENYEDVASVEGIKVSNDLLDFELKMAHQNNMKCVQG